jgi:hypothetical protein
MYSLGAEPIKTTHYAQIWLPASQSRAEGRESVRLRNEPNELRNHQTELRNHRTELRNEPSELRNYRTNQT